MPIDLVLPRQVWCCPNCTFRDVTREAHPHTRFHACSGLGGLTAPMVREGDRVHVVVNEREDYVGTEDVQYADGRPIQSITTEHPDGHTDVAVYAPTAHLVGK
jgi:hypothetical protein